MSRKNRTRPSPALKQAPMARESSQAKRFTADSFQNFESRVGIATNNQSSSGHYSFDFISRNRVQLEAMYRSSWIVGQAVDVVAEDMTRAGIDHEGDADPGDLARIDREFERMQLWDRLCDTVKWSRLYGGAIAVMLIDGQKMDTPLRIDTVTRGQFKGLLVLDRWLVQPTLQNLVQEMGPDFGIPEFYDVVADSMALKRQRIHHSRVLRLDGVDLPYWQRISENLWGQSVIERLFDRLIAFDSTTAGAAQLVYKAHLRTYAVDNLRDIIGMGGPALEGLLKQIDMIRRFQTNEGMTLMDAKDKFETHQYTFSGLSDVLLQFGQQLSGALQIPLVRLFGQSPAGLNSTGESDIKTYYDHIKQQQERRLSSPLTRLMGVMFRSVLGVPMPDDYNFSFNHLLQLSEVERADVAGKITTTVLEAYDAGVIPQRVALEELRQSAGITGIWSNVGDDLIEAADDELPDMSEGLPNEGPSQLPDPGSEEGAQPGPGAPGRNAVRGQAEGSGA
ncbi:DUF1073 domain-containing protein [Rhodanobacter glycinis]|uniref:DUF1073 domain-containing protein n=1 Tax=Rhodanobacter glycinis TaxID=582702 RepID=A0A5B9DYB9_9GAMM|nr:DUF1073 domain-containing protein [Rhodanobacter glycinis]QEE24578.1 DUF1073 domain-containing protein [Rhodanobacter glycinis]